MTKPIPKPEYEDRQLKRISLMYPANCQACANRLGCAEPAWYQKEIGVFCLDCKPSPEERQRILTGRPRRHWNPRDTR